jgi:hypothetical protein
MECVARDRSNIRSVNLILSYWIVKINFFDVNKKRKLIDENYYRSLINEWCSFSDS